MRVTRYVFRPMLAAGIVLSAAACGGDDGGVRAAAPPSSSDADVFVDPDEGYEMEVAPGWQAQHDLVAAGMESWLVEESAGGFAANVNVVTRSGRSGDLGEFVDEMLSGITAADMNAAVEAEMPDSEASFQTLRPIGSDVIDGVHNDLGVVEYEAIISGEPVRSYGLVAQQPKGVAVATFAATTESFERLFAEVEPYLLTLRAT